MNAIQLYLIANISLALIMYLARAAYIRKLPRWGLLYTAMAAVAYLPLTIIGVVWAIFDPKVRKQFAKDWKEQAR